MSNQKMFLGEREYSIYSYRLAIWVNSGILANIMMESFNSASGHVVIYVREYVAWFCGLNLWDLFVKGCLFLEYICPVQIRTYVK